MKRLIIIFGITFILLIIIIFSKNKYLGIYNEYITIFYDFPLEEEYEWSYTMNNENILELNKYEEPFKWKFKAIGEGIVSLEFVYKKDDNIKYKIIYDFNIKNKKIFWTKGEGFGMMYYPDPI